MLNRIDDVMMLSALSENYEAIFYADLDLDTITPIRVSEFVENSFGDYFRTSPSYREAMANYSAVVVYDEDKPYLYKMAEPEYIKKKLNGKSVYSFDYRIIEENEMKCYRIKFANLDGIGEVHKVAIGYADVTPEADRINAMIESQAMLKVLERDELTGLYTKEFFFKKVEEYRKRFPNEKLMIWISDVQGLKLINERYGMEMGDEVLRIMAAGGQTFPNMLFGGRIEGDKFSALMLDRETTVDGISKDTTAYNDNNFPIPNVIIKHGVYHIKPDDTLSVQAMCDRAVLALQSIKNKFGQKIAVYNEQLTNDLIMNRQIMENAEKALKNGEFCVYYQPKVDTKSNIVAGAEALVRWVHPEFGFMSPGTFIPLFEQNGFIKELDYYIWEEVCKAICKWKNDGVKVVPISVNVSRNDFENEKLADMIIELVDRYEIEHNLIQLEITESSYSDNPEVITSTIKRLHDAGFIIALDDFGTGYSSMIALSSLNLDIMKLDMSLIQNDIPGTEKNVLEFSMDLAKMMKLKTVAEGVETDEQAERIKQLGGDYIQGYYYSVPLSIDDYESYIESRE